MSQHDYDLLIIGGGINGAAIARDASGRGLKVGLFEKDDLAQHTSSASTKLIHGGLRYLEYYEFRLVREALKEREVMLRSAPHIIWPMRFILPYDKGLRPAWFLRLGLFFYDALGGLKRSLPGTKTVKLQSGNHKGILKSRLTKGFEYSDCWVEDARLVVLNAKDAAERGADIELGTKVTAIDAQQGGFIVTVKKGRKSRKVTARAVVNAAGPWVDDVYRTADHGKNEQELRLIKGSHIVVDKLYDGAHSYIFQNGDGRIVFAIPYEREYTLIGTTDVPYQLTEGKPKISAEETQYLCDAINEYLQKEITPKDVKWSYSGVRPLYNDGDSSASKVTRDYVLDVDELEPDAPILSIYGGKITTSRKLAEHAVQKLAKYYPDLPGDWTAGSVLPGGDVGAGGYDAFVTELLRDFPKTDADILRRLARGYGTAVRDMLSGKYVKREGDLGRIFGAGLCEAEVRYLVAEEWAGSADAVLWRRSKLGLHMTPKQRKTFTEWFEKTFG